MDSPGYMAQNKWVSLGLFHPEISGDVGPLLPKLVFGAHLAPTLII